MKWQKSTSKPYCEFGALFYCSFDFTSKSGPLINVMKKFKLAFHNAFYKVMTNQQFTVIQLNICAKIFQQKQKPSYLFNFVSNMARDQIDS